MKDNERYVVHRFTGHPVAGVNWRPTRLVDDVPEVRKCRVCEVIPKKIVKLPCKHFLCESCLVCASQSGSGLCPLGSHNLQGSEVHSHNLPCQESQPLESEYEALHL
ncbi:hypothetical protein MRX96_022067 [Rhipicephalus microplus]